MGLRGEQYTWRDPGCRWQSRLVTKLYFEWAIVNARYAAPGVPALRPYYAEQRARDVPGDCAGGELRTGATGGANESGECAAIGLSILVVFR